MPPDDTQTTQQTTQQQDAGAQSTTQQDTSAQATQTQTETQAERFVPAARFDAVVGQKYEAIRKAESLEARTRELEGRIAQYEQQRTQTQVTQQTTQATQTQAEPGVRTFTSNVSPAELDRLADLRARQTPRQSHIRVF